MVIRHIVLGFSGWPSLTSWRPNGALTGVVGHHEWAADPKFCDLAGWLVHQEAHDALIGGWAQSLEAYQTMLSLQQAGVSAGVCQTAEDCCDHDS